MECRVGREDENKKKVFTGLGWCFFVLLQTMVGIR